MPCGEGCGDGGCRNAKKGCGGKCDCLHLNYEGLVP